MKGQVPARFGPYEIVGQLGAGGMGEVYRARDHRLQREVALKILPESAASNPDRQRRFAQEAITASALNHPNILAVYDVGVEGGTPYLVSELIEGTSLRHEMSQGRIPIKRLLDLSLQIAQGLAAAHEAGIVHRDLKPENVMVTRDGRVKILDFGLAKVFAEDGELANPPVLTQTAPGLVIGTVPYMSPEQARGARADFRSDQFALGVVLYEMSTGTHPFRRDTAVQTLSAVIGEEPPPLSELHAALPVPLRWLIGRLLAKSPRERYAHTADIAADLRTIRDHLTEATLPAAAPRETATRRRAIGWAALGLTVACATFALGLMFAPVGVDLTSYKFTPLATDAGFQGAPAFSPDGRTVAYVAEVDDVLQVFTRSLASPTRFQVTHSRFDCHDPFWSPDGTRIYYHSLARDKEALWQVSPAGGQPEHIIDGATHAAISPDGRTLAFLRSESDRNLQFTLSFSSPPGAEPRRFKDFGFSDGQLRFSPDGSRLLVWGTTGHGFDVFKSNNGFWMIRPDEGKATPVLPSLAGTRIPTVFSWLPDGRHIVFAQDDGRTPGTHLWLANVDTDDARPLTVTSGSEGGPSVAPNGKRLAFTSEATDFDLVLVPADGSGLQTFLSSTRNELDPAWSPNGAQHAFITDRSGRQEIWLRNQDATFERPLVTDADFPEQTVVFGSLAFSPDGQRLAYQRFAPATGWRIWISTVAGGSPVRLTTGPENDRYQDGPTWSPEGDWVAFASGSRGAQAPDSPAAWQSLVRARVGSGSAAPVVVRRGIVPFARPQWSPDGRWIACQTPEGLTLSSPDGKKSRAISEADWITYGWSSDGARIYGLQPADDLHHFMLVALDIKTGEERVINANLGPIPQANQPIRGFSRIGDRGFMTSIARVRSDIWLLEGFRAPGGWRDRLWPFRWFGN